MTRLALIEALNGLHPNTSWDLNGNTYADLSWMDTITPKPTEDELKIYAAANAYKDLRVAEYPPITDQLDAIMKGGQDFIDMQTLCASVKAKYPKP